MIQLQVTSSGLPDRVFKSGSLPVSFGRGTSDPWRADAPGVWESHFRIELDADGNFQLISNPNAITKVAGNRVTEVRLKAGDTIQAGSIDMVFSMSEAVQTGLVARERFVWGLVGLLGLLQLASAAALFWDAWRF